MNRLRATIVFSVLMAIGIASIFISSCSEKAMNGAIIFTRCSEKPKNTNYDTTDSWRYISHTQIVAINSNSPDRSLKVLTNDYYSARSPKISYDGKYMLFSAQQKLNDPWQIWEMNLKDLKSHQITTSKESSTDPDYLPGGRIVFSKFSANDTLKAGNSLFICNLDGSNLKRITFNPGSYVASNVLTDGRILTISRQVFPIQGDPMYMILRPDGTKADMFYKGSKNLYISSPALETGNGRIVFIETDKASGGKSNLMSISYNRPLHSSENLSSEIEGNFHSVSPMRSGNLLVSYRKSDSDRHALYEFDPENKTIGKMIYGDAEYDVLEAIEAVQHERPKKLPSEVDMGVKTGLLMCQDINLTDQSQSGSSNSGSSPKSSRIEIVGIDSTLGIVDVAEDGSFYLKVIADKPFRIQTVDKQGHVSNSSCGWMWLRPNERRGCVGCHQDPEIVPGNRVPLAVKNSPVSIPMHISKVVEKKVSLE
jgi:Tol biopolymer transport system component